MDKIQETYENASWIFRELITLGKFRAEMKILSQKEKKEQ